MEAALTKTFMDLSGSLDEAGVVYPLRRGNPDQVARFFDFAGFEASLLALTQDALAEQAAWSARKELRDVFGLRIQKATSPQLLGDLAASLRTTSPVMVRWARQHAGWLVRNVADTTRTAIRQAVVTAFTEQLDVDATARMLRNIVGPLPRQARAAAQGFAESYSAALAAGATPARAMQVASRVLRAATARAVRSRSRTIARTEIKAAENFGRRLGWSELDARGILPDETFKEWITADPCPLCSELDGEIVRWDASFSAGVEGPPLHPNCVCDTILVLPDEMGF